jgi:hypothetical protein
MGVESMNIEEQFQFLDSKYENYHPTADYYKYKKWNLHNYGYYGCDYGLELLYKTDSKMWIIRQLLDSGYSTGKDLIITPEWEKIEGWVEVLAPTNKEYKTDRK